MKLPAIFHWPTPWLWGALAVLFAADGDGVWDVVEAAAIVTILASVVYFLHERRNRRHGIAAGSATSPAFDARLDAIERRLTDTQDVMIALSEKVDQWEADRARSRVGAPAAEGTR